MDLELVNFVNSDLTWNTVRKGHRSVVRRPKKAGASSFEFGLGLGNKICDRAPFDYEKSGVAVLGQRFAEEVLDVPIKKRILLLQSPSLNGAEALSPQPQPQAPPLHHEESGQPVLREHASGQLCNSNSPSSIREIKFKNGLSNSEPLKLTKKEVSDLNDFSGIELLAAAACDNSIYDSSDNVESSAVEERTVPKVDSYTDGTKEHIAPMDSDDSSVQDNTKEHIAPMDSDDSSVQDNTFPVAQNPCDSGNDGGDKRLLPSKDVRLHWDLNTVMDEWEEPCYDIAVDPHSQKSYLDDSYNDGLPNAKANLEGYETKNSVVTGGEQGSMLHNDCANQSGKHDAAISVGPLIKQEIFGIQGINDDDSFGKAYDMAEDIASSREMVGASTCKTSDADSCLSKSDVDSFVHPAKCENFSTSTVSVSLGQTVIKVESDTIHDLPVCFEPSKNSDDRQPVSEVMVRGGSLSLKGECDYKLTSEDRLSDCCGSNVSQDERGHMAEGNTIDKVRAGYDSPFEDGELREPIGHSWQKNEVEERDSVDFEQKNEVEERDCVDFECDNIYEVDFDTIESEKNEVTLGHDQTIGDGSFLLETRALGAGPHSDIEQGHNDIEQGAKADASKSLNCLSASKASGCQLQEHSEHMTVKENSGSSGHFLPARKNGHDESRTLGGNLLCSDRSTSFGAPRNSAYIHRSRSGNIEDSYSRAEKDFGPEKFMGRDGLSYQGRGRNDASGQSVESSLEAWDSRNSHRYHRPKNVIGGSAARSGGSSGIDNSQAINYNLGDIYRTFDRRASPSDRNDAYGVHRGTQARSVNRDRCRGGSGFHLPGLRRAPQEEYNDLEPCYSERKVRCFSPSFGRGAHLSRSRRRSRSRSRSGSPIAWHFQKRRNVDTKRQSPDYRSDTRFQGERFLFRKPSFSGEFEAGFASPTRHRVSPQCISRSFDDRNVINGPFRDRKLSPVRTYQRNQRFEASGYLGRLKSNDHFRPTPRPGRFPQITGPTREHKFEDNSNDCRIHDDKYGMMNGGRRFRHTVDDSFKTRNPRNKDNGFRYTRNENRCFKDPIGRDVPEDTSEEKGCGYTMNKMFNTPLLSAGEGDFHKR